MCAAWLAAPAAARAHAVLTRASLAEAAVTAGTATTVTLQFNTGIEPKLTRVLLVTTAGEERALELVAAGPAALRVSLPPLAAGAYGLRYKVLAADGHVTESVLRFQVAPAR